MSKKKKFKRAGEKEKRIKEKGEKRKGARSQTH